MKMKSDLLHVIAPLYNPIRFANRMKVYELFERHMIESGVNLHVPECATGNRPHELTGRPHINHIPLRSKSLVWTKENLINLALARLPDDWKYVAWIDADVIFRNKNWAAETVHALQQYDVVQPWSDCYDLGPQGQHLNHWKSFCHQHWHREKMGHGGSYKLAHPGYAWAATRQAMESLGGLIETAALGAADHHMAWALIGRIQHSLPKGLTPGYIQPLVLWQERALRHINHNIGVVHGSTIEHQWHGRKDDRQYTGRWSIVIDNQFDPATDLKRNSHGVFELTHAKPKLRLDIDHYFRQRNEDLNG
jgi:hypothetical protein